MAIGKQELHVTLFQIAKLRDHDNDLSTFSLSDATPSGSDVE
jgi:hypothetical protein